LASELALSEAAPLFAALLSLPLPERYPALMLTPQKQKEKTSQAVVALLVEYARGRVPAPCLIRTQKLKQYKLQQTRRAFALRFTPSV